MKPNFGVFVLSTALAALAITAGCKHAADTAHPADSTHPTAQAPAPDAQLLMAQQWQFIIYDAAGAVVLDDAAYHIQFDTDNLHVEGGCNLLNADYRLHGSQLDIGPLSSTLRACVDSAAQTNDTIVGQLLHAQKPQLQILQQQPLQVQLLFPDGQRLVLRAAAPKTP